MVTIPRMVLLAVLLATGVARLGAQNLPSPDDMRHSMLRAAMLGVLPLQASIYGGKATTAHSSPTHGQSTSRLLCHDRFASASPRTAPAYTARCSKLLMPEAVSRFAKYSAR